MGPDIRRILDKTGYPVRPDTKFPYPAKIWPDIRSDIRHYPAGYPVIRPDFRHFLANTGYPDPAGYQKFTIRHYPDPAGYQNFISCPSLLMTKERMMSMYV